MSKPDDVAQTVEMSLGQPSVRIWFNLYGQKIDIFVTPIELYHMWVEFDNMKRKLEEEGLL